MEKRFRDENGLLNCSLEELKEKTRAEGLSYYKVGHVYGHENKVYVYVENIDGLARFQLYKSDKEILIPVENLGTFLPDVASEGREIEFLY